MSKKSVLAILFAGVASLFAVAALNAGLEGCPDVITMKHEQAFEQHRMGIVDFTHTKHVEDYGFSCGECHHDASGNPTDDITCQDDVTSCIDCHNKPGQPRVDRSLPEEERLKLEREYFLGAIHQNCIDCHREQNEKAGKKSPVACTECHPRP
jgi:hypothetical protein